MKTNKQFLLLSLIMLFVGSPIFATNPYTKQGSKFTFKIHSYSSYIGSSISRSDNTFYLDWYVVDYDSKSQISQIQQWYRTENWENYSNYKVDTIWIKPYNEYAYISSKDKGTTWSFFYSSEDTPEIGSGEFCGETMKTYKYAESEGGVTSVYTLDGTKISSDNESKTRRTWTELGISEVYSYNHTEKSNTTSTSLYERTLIYASIPGQNEYYDKSVYFKPVCNYFEGIYNPSWQLHPEGSSYTNNVYGYISVLYKKDTHATGYKIYAMCLDDFRSGYVSDSFPFNNLKTYDYYIYGTANGNDTIGTYSFGYLTNLNIDVEYMMKGVEWLFFVVPYNELFVNTDNLEALIYEINQQEDYTSAYNYVVNKINTLATQFPAVYLNLRNSDYYQWYCDLTPYNDNDVDDISVDNMQQPLSTDKYNLQGQKIQTSRKGLYIQNGKLYYQK